MQYAAVLLAAVAASASAKAIPSQPVSAHPVEPTGNYPSATVPPLERVYPTLLSLSKNDENEECYVNVKTPNCNGRSARVGVYDSKLGGCVRKSCLSLTLKLSPCSLQITDDPNVPENPAYGEAQICKDYAVQWYSRKLYDIRGAVVPAGQVNFYFFNGINETTPVNFNWTAPLGDIPGTWSGYNTTGTCWRGNGTAMDHNSC